MTSPKLFYQKIDIQRMAGFEEGFKVEDLSPGVNIIYGPNASGKTTLSRIMKHLLRPQDKAQGTHADHLTQAHIIASLSVDDQAYIIHFDYGQAKCQQSGRDIDPLSLAPVELGNSNVLALHDLIGESEDKNNSGNLAAAILKESAGGYDIAQAKNDLDYRARPSTKRKSVNLLEERIEDRRIAEARQEELAQRERNLNRLKNDLAEANQARQVIRDLEKAAQYNNALAKHSELSRQADAFPAGIAKLLGTEIKDIGNLRNRLDALEKESRLEQQQLNVAQQQINDSPLAQAGIPAELVLALRRKCDSLRQRQTNLQTKQSEQRREESQFASAMKHLGRKTRLDQIEILDSEAVEGLFKTAREASDLKAKQAAADKLHQWLGQSEAGGDNDLLTEGIQLLERFLATPSKEASPTQSKTGLYIVAASTALLAIILAITVHWLTLLFLLPAAGLIAWSFLPKNSAEDPLPELQKKFNSLGLVEIRQWNEKDVRNSQRQLRKQLSAETLDQEKQQRWASLGGEMDSLTLQRESINLQIDEWKSRLGVDLSDETALAALAENIRRVQQAEANLAATESELQAAQDLYDKSISGISSDLSPFDFDQATDPETAVAQVEQLDLLRQSQAAAHIAEQNAQASLARLEKETRTVTNQVREIFERVGLTLQEEDQLHKWAEMREDYLAVDKSLLLAEGELNTAKNDLKDGDQLEELSSQQIDDSLAACRRQTEQIDSLSEEIWSIEKEVAAVKETADLEQAIFHEQQAEEQLRSERDGDCQAMVGDLLTDFIEKQQHDREQPEVFRRAEQLFARFTHGRYRLDIEKGDPPAFRAFNTSLGQGEPLDHLSSGTRLQLLLAVRVAFVERQELAYKLPLFFDETLGNSDERRAREIIDAAIELCREGRQVFYFTAQHDEVGKWISLLDGNQEIPHRLIDLAKVRRFSPTETVTPIETQPPPEDQFPEPGELSWLEYGKLLQVPAIRPDHAIGGTQLWYLIDDPSQLYDLLRNGVNKWGQLQTLVQFAGADSLTYDSETFQKAEAAAGTIDEIIKCWRIGRGKPVDRQTLVDSGAVSDHYLDSVEELALQIGGDAEALLAKLNSGEVSGFRKNKRHELRDYFEENGHLDDQEIWTLHQIREQVCAKRFRDLKNNLINRQRVFQLIDLIASNSAPPNEEERDEPPSTSDNPTDEEPYRLSPNVLSPDGPTKQSEKKPSANET